MASDVDGPSKDSQMQWLLFAPLIALVTFALRALLHWSTSAPGALWPDSLRTAEVSYLSALAVLLFVERWYPRQDSRENRLLEVLVAAVGIAVSAVLVWRGLMDYGLADLRFAAIGTVSSSTFMVTRRTDGLRCLAFMLMALVSIHFPLVTIRPPHLSFSLLAGGAAVICFAGAGIRWDRAAGAVLGLLMTLSGIYGVAAAYQGGFPMWSFLAGIATLYFAAGTVVLITRGSWRERKSHH